MKKIIPYLFIPALLIANLPAFGIGRTGDDPVLLTIANKPVSVSEFLHMYEKNNTQAVGTREDIDTYLQRFIDFKLKVAEAENMGLDTLPGFKKELAGYREQLVKPYLLDSSTIEMMVHEAYNHMRYEVNASHILIRCGMEASPADTLDAYTRIIQVRQKILEGTPFEQMARAVSDDPSAKSNGGNLGYFTALQMVYPFEKAVYALQPGEISMPVRTRFGYHIIRLNDKRLNPGTVKVAHIMVAVPRSSGPEKQKEAYEKIKNIYKQLTAGASFDTIARKYSDDYNSAKNGGILPWFGTGKMIPAFEQAAFALKNPGDISEPVQTGYGWHIIKLLDKKELPAYKEISESLRRKVLSSDRGQMAKTALVKKLINKYQVMVDSALLDQVAANGDLDNDHFIPVVPSSDYEKPLATGNGFSVTMKDFLKTLNKSHPKPSESIHHFIFKTFENLLSNRLLAYKKSQLENTNPEFRAIMQEYHDGMLLFEIMDRKVWSKASHDTTGLKAYYNTHKNAYMTEKRQMATIYHFNDPRFAKSLTKDIRKVSRKKLTDKQLIEKYKNKNAGISVETDTLLISDQRFGKSLSWEKGISGMIRKENGFYIVNTKEIFPEEPKPLDEIRGIVTADYQDYLEKQWIIRLRKKYPVVIHQDVLSGIKNKI
ncbi:MAG: peptidylprolyl isomerase [Chlorobi bacterium]|nr:peptidylprolyl isomerase [Chlorobiota bacterium]